VKLSPGFLFEVKLATAQLSLAVGAVQLATWSHVARPIPVFTTMFPGHPLMTGRVMSETVSVPESVLVKPDLAA
jgi:hypothetical protein